MAAARSPACRVGLGNQDDHEVFKALRASADAVLVGLGTVFAEHYHVPESPDLRIYVIADHVDISGDEELFEGGRTTLVLPLDAGADAARHPGSARRIEGRDRSERSRHEPRGSDRASSKVVRAWRAQMVALGLVDDSSSRSRQRVIAGNSPRVVHGPDADAEPWNLEHGFVDNEGFMFLRYGRAR